MKKEKVKIDRLLLDHNIYPRHRIDDVSVSGIVRVLRAGHKVPPIVVDKKTRRVVDGFHRVAAFRRLELEEIDAYMRPYKGEAEMLEGAIRLNSDHGSRLSSYDRARCIQLATEFGLPEARLADALLMSEQQVGDLRARRTATDADGQIVPIKMSLAHKAGGRLTRRQVAGNRAAGGKNFVFYINQVVNALENDLVSMESESVAESLGRLRESLRKFAAKDGRKTG